MELREQLMELLKTVPTRDGGYCDLQEIADHLIASGVDIPVRCKVYSNRNTVDCPLEHSGNYFVEEDRGFCYWGKVGN